MTAHDPLQDEWQEILNISREKRLSPQEIEKERLRKDLYRSAMYAI